MCLRIKSFLMALLMCFLALFGSSIVEKYRVTAPKGFSNYTEKEAVIVDDADFYVSVNGSDTNDGSLDAPFATIEKAKKEDKTLVGEDADGELVEHMGDKQIIRHPAVSEKSLYKALAHAGIDHNGPQIKPS